MSYRAKCPIRPGDPCSLCFPGASGPQDCGLVWLAKDDPELVEAWRNRNTPAEESTSVGAVKTLRGVRFARDTSASVPG